MLSRFSFILLFLCAFSTTLYADSVTWLEKSHDYGSILEEDGKATCNMRFVNTLNAEITIDYAKATCGCTFVRYPKHAIAVGDTASISIVYDPRRRPGRFLKTVNIRFTNGDRDTLKIIGNVIGNEETISSLYPFSCGALRLKNNIAMVGQVQKGDLRSTAISGINPGRDSIDVEFTNLPKYLDVITIPKVATTGDVVTMSIYYASTTSPHWGLHTDTITAIVHNRATGVRDSMNVEVMSRVVENFRNLTDEQRAKAPILVLSADRINVGTIKPNAISTASLTITNQGETPLTIHAVECMNQALSVTPSRLTIEPNKNASINIQLNSSLINETEKIFNSSITLISNAVATPQQPVTIVGEFSNQ